MDFPFSVFSDLLAEFQKYLTDRISRPVYWALGLVVAALGIIIGSIVGWSVVLDAWNKTDAVYRLVLGGVAVVIFLLLAYVLGSLQGTVERWFQGERLILGHRLTGQLKRHQVIWTEHEVELQAMTDLYEAIRNDLDAMTQWGRPQDASKPMLQTRRALPRYAIITDQDLEITTAAAAPPGALHDLQVTIGMMVQHPLDTGATVTDADLLCLPAGLANAVIMALSVSSLIVPIGLLPGDLIVIYARERRKAHVTALNAALVVALQPLTCQENDGAQADLVHLTLAVAPDDIASFATLSSKRVQGLVRLAPIDAPSTNPSPQPTPASQPSSPTELAAQDLPTDARIAEQLATLKEQYEAGQYWLKHLREGILDPNVPPHAEALNEAFKLIGRRAHTASSDQLKDWRSTANNYRNGWIRLLGDAFQEMEYRIDQHQKAFYLYYPATREQVAATAIGNVFRAVESYCEKLYGLDLALVLPRIQIVMEQDTRDQLTKAHDQLALLEWLYLSSTTIGIIGTTLAFFHQSYWFALLLWLLVLPVPHFLLYPAALAAALDYAAALRLAVDRERSKVIAQAGFSLPSPTNQEQEKELWKQIQQWWIYGASPGNYTLKGTSSEQNT